MKQIDLGEIRAKKKEFFMVKKYFQQKSLKKHTHKKTAKKCKKAFFLCFPPATMH